MGNPNGHIFPEKDEVTVPPIAVVGMALRLPGDISSTSSFWSCLMDKTDTSSPVPPDRYNIDAFHSPNKPGMVRPQRGYFLSQDYVNQADMGFQGAGYDALQLDPQQTLLMEVVWECMENAGQTEWQGRDIAVYVGVFGEDWSDLKCKETGELSREHAFATGGFALSNLVSFQYNLRGQSATIQTACSSSLTAVHEACQALYSRSCESAIVAGTNMILTPTMTITISDNGILSPDGRCKTFDAGADGYARGEAVNAVLLKRLDDAVRDGDPIRGVIRSTSTNYDGNSSHIWAPNMRSQETLIRQAYRRAGIEDLTQTAFVECHGTGTRSGDVVETTAIARAFSSEELYVGAVKPNFGHSEGASGLTSLIKAVLALENRIIPPNLHFETPNPKIPFHRGLRVPVEAVPWPSNRKERVSVNSFGIGGANAHAIVESASPFKVDEAPSEPKAHLLVTSAHSEASLQQRVSDIQKYAEHNPKIIQDLAFTLGVKRDHQSHRAFMIANDDGTLEEPVLSKPVAISSVVFAFTGQGTQWPGMAKELLTSVDSFRADIKNMDRILQRLPDPPVWSIEDELLHPGISKTVSKTELSQTLCAAVQIALVNLIVEWGISPSAVVGHSSGEIAAAYASGAIPFESAIITAYFRGQIVKSSARPGGMVVVGLGSSVARQYLVDGVVVACDNSPESVNLSGDRDRLEIVLETILAEHPDAFYKRLPVDVAYHSSHMNDLGPSYEAAIRPYITATTGRRIPMYSSVTGQTLTPPDELDAAYWRRNLESPVLFYPAIKSILDEQTSDRPTVFLEIGVHSDLSTPLRQISAHLKKPISHIATLRRHSDQYLSILHSVGHLYISNQVPLFAAVSGTGTTLSDLPVYPWDRRNIHRQESRLTRNWRFRKHAPHELLGSRALESTELEPSWRNLLRTAQVGWLSDHQILGDAVFPAAGYIAMIAEAVRQVSESNQGCWIEKLVIKTPLIIGRKAAMTEIMTTLKPVRYSDRVDSEWWEVTVSSFNGTTWTRNCVGQAKSDSASYGNLFSGIPIENLPRPVAPEAWYRAMKSVGFELGSQFQLLEDITTHPLEHVARATIRTNHDHIAYPMHPTIIDQCLQLIGLAGCRGRTTLIDRVAIPAYIESAYIGNPQERKTMLAEVKGTSSFGTRATCDARLRVGEETVLSLHGLMIVELDRETQEDKFPLASYIEWEPDLDLVPLGKALSSETSESRILMNQLSALSVVQIHRAIMDVSSVPQFEGYKQWICEQVNNTKEHMIPEAQEWITLDDIALQCLRNGLSEKLRPYDLAEISCLSTKVTETCADIVRGELDPVEVLSDERLKAVYEHTETSDRLTQLLGLMRHSNPRLRVLDIGIGPARLTSCVFEALISAEGRCWEKYTWAGTSSDAVEAAKERYGDHVEYCTFDGSLHQGLKGLQNSRYNIVIVSDALHTIPGIDAVLWNIKTLLVPGGWIVMKRTGSLDYVTGLLPQSGTKEAHFKYSTEWQSLLEAAQFADISMDVSDQLIMAKTPEPLLEPTSIDILIPDIPSHPWHRSLEVALSDRGFSVKAHSLDGPVAKDALVISLLDLDTPFLKSMTTDQLSALQALLAATPRILWVTHSAQVKCADPDFGLILGAARSIRQELSIPFTTLEVDQFTPSALDTVLSVHDKLRRQQSGDGLEAKDYEFVINDGIVYTGRFHWNFLNDMLTARLEQDTPLKLDIASYGVIGSLGWVPDETVSLGPDDVEVDIRYVGLNFRDIMISLGVMANKDELGVEGSGIITRTGSNVRHLHPGQKVGMLYTGLLRSRRIVPAAVCFEVPATLSLEDAAGVPVVFSTVIFSLIDTAQLRKGQSILIQAACGGVGLAAIQLCQTIGAEIYCTVGSEKKARYLTEEFGIPRHRIFNSRDVSFLQGVMSETNGEGVDIVLNSLSGPLLHASWQCVAQFGKMIELGKRDFLEHGMLRMDLFGKNRSFIGVDLFELAKEPGVIAGLYDGILDFIQEGKLQPIRPLKVMPAAEVEQAFRHMQQGQHMGKIVVQMPESPASLQVSKTRQSVAFDPNAAYLLVGGLGGIGRSIATWMVEQGAKHLIFLSRSAGRSKDDQVFLDELQVQGCDARAIQGDVSVLADVQRAVDSCTQPIRGVLQLSMHIRDQFVRDITHTNWTAVLAPKVTGTWNLHYALQASPLSFFVLCSSIAGLMGSPGQANYAAANTFLNSFTQFRLRQNLPASVLSLGGVDDIGFLATQNTRVRNNMRAASVRMLREQEVLDAFEVAITGRTVPLSSFSRTSLVPQEFAVGLSSTKPLDDPTVRPLWGEDARFMHYRDVASTPSDEPTAHPAQALRELIAHARAIVAAAKGESGHTAVTEAFFTSAQRTKIRKAILDGIQAFSIFGEDLDHETLSKVKIDSLMIVELRNWFRRHLGLNVSIGDVAGAGTLGGLEDMMIRGFLAENSTN